MWLRPAHAQSRSVSAHSTAPTRFAHLSDFHWGYRGELNRDPAASWDRAWAVLQRWSPAVDFVVVTGDLIEATASDSERRARLLAVRERLDQLRLPYVTVPGEHDAFGDRGRVYQDVFGDRFFMRQVGPFQVLGLDNVTEGPFLGASQRAWLKTAATRINPEKPLLVLAHRPLYDLFVPWNWYTYDGVDVYQSLRLIKQLGVFFGHIHQVVDQTVHGRPHWSGLSTAYPLPEPGFLVRLSGWPQSASHPDMGLGLRVARWNAESGFRMTTAWLDRHQEGVS
jgi:Icc protein